MDNWRTILLVWKTFLKLGWQAKKKILFLVICLIPVAILAVARILQATQGGAPAAPLELFNRIMLVYYFQLLIPVLALFYGSSVVGDEVEDKTLVYLSTRPIAKARLLLGKYLGNFTLMVLLTESGFLLSFALGNFHRFDTLACWQELLRFVGVSLLALLAYSGIFLVLGSFMRKSILLGLFFIFGWESVVQYFPGSTQKFTLIHYVKSLLPSIPEQTSFLSLQLEPSPVIESVLMLLLIGVLGVIAATIVFQKKEYLLSDSV